MADLNSFFSGLFLGVVLLAPFVILLGYKAWSLEKFLEEWKEISQGWEDISKTWKENFIEALNLHDEDEEDSEEHTHH